MTRAVDEGPVDFLAGALHRPAQDGLASRALLHDSLESRSVLDEQIGATRSAVDAVAERLRCPSYYREDLLQGAMCWIGRPATYRCDVLVTFL